MKSFFTGILVLFLSTTASSGYLCQKFSSEEECHQDAYQDILKSLQEDIQSQKSSVSPEEYIEKISDYLPYDTFTSMFQKCEAKLQDRQSALSCIYNDIKKFITSPIDNSKAEKFLLDTLPNIIYDWDVENLKEYAINSKLTDDFKELSQNIKPLAHSCKINILDVVGRKIDVDTGNILYEYKIDLNCTPKNAKLQTLLISMPDGYKYFNLDCTALLGDFGRLEDYDVENFGELFDIMKKKSLTEGNSIKE